MLLVQPVCMLCENVEQFPVSIVEAMFSFCYNVSSVVLVEPVLENLSAVDVATLCWFFGLLHLFAVLCQTSVTFIVS